MTRRVYGNDCQRESRVLAAETSTGMTLENGTRPFTGSKSRESLSNSAREGPLGKENRALGRFLGNAEEIANLRIGGESGIL